MYWCYLEALSLGSSGTIETLRSFLVSSLSLNFTQYVSVGEVPWMELVGRGSLLINDCDLLVLLVGQAFGFDPVENTLFAVAHRFPFVEW